MRTYKEKLVFAGGHDGVGPASRFTSVSEVPGETRARPGPSQNPLRSLDRVPEEEISGSLRVRAGEIFRFHAIKEVSSSPRAMHTHLQRITHTTPFMKEPGGAWLALTRPLTPHGQGLHHTLSAGPTLHAHGVRERSALDAGSIVTCEADINHFPTFREPREDTQYSVTKPVATQVHSKKVTTRRSNAAGLASIIPGQAPDRVKTKHAHAQVGSIA